MFNITNHQSQTAADRSRHRPKRASRTRAASVLVAFAFAAAACGGETDAATDVAAATTIAQAAAPADTPAAGPSISVVSTEIGEVLADPSGLTLYGFLDDTESVSTCFDSCATAWPPADGSLGTPAELAAVSFDSIDRPDGSSQLRVGGRWPLYTFAGDGAAGDVTGQESGGVWFAAAADGSLIGIDDDGSAAASAAPAAPAADEKADEPAAAPDTAAVDSDLGPLLTNADGRTVYAFANDSDRTSNCNDPCSTTWPPIDPSDTLSPVLPTRRLTLVTRADGSQQQALDGQPIYLFKDDAAAGDVKGQGVGNVWFAVSAEGKVLTPPSIRIGSTDSGDILINDDGFALYTFANDEEGTSSCSDPCSTTWPPVSGETRIDPSLNADQFASFSRDDGTTQLAVNGQPVYTFVGDENPGDTNGVGVGSPGTWSTVGSSDVDLADASSAQESSDTEEETAAPAAPAAVGDIKIRDTDIGQVLTNADGLTLYGFLDDSPTASVCNGACAKAWPPLAGNSTLDGSVPTTPAISNITRDDASSQTAIGIWPAYTFAGDGAPGDIAGQGSGDVWFALAPDGSLIK